MIKKKIIIIIKIKKITTKYQRHGAGGGALIAWITNNENIVRNDY